MRILFTSLICLFVLSFQPCFAQLKSLQHLKNLKTEGDSLLKAKEYDKAVALYESVLTDMPIIDATLYYEIAIIYFTKNDHIKTQNTLDKALVLAKKSNSDKMIAVIYILYSRIYSKEGDKKKAVQLLKKSLKYDDKIVEAYANLAHLYLKMSKNKDALKMARKAIQTNNKDAYAYNNAGLALIRLKKYEEGKKMIMTSLELDSTNPYAYKHLAYYYLGINDTEKACKALEEAENLGYKEFGNEADQNEVNELIQKHCK